MHNQKKTKKQKTLLRLFKTVFQFYPVALPVVLICIIFSAVVSSMPSIFMQNIIAEVEKTWQTGDWASASKTILPYVGLLIGFYVFALVSAFAFTRMMAVISQMCIRDRD